MGDETSSALEIDVFCRRFARGSFFWKDLMISDILANLFRAQDAMVIEVFRLKSFTIKLD